jgi:hypothetical protein
MRTALGSTLVRPTGQTLRRGSFATLKKVLRHEKGLELTAAARIGFGGTYPMQAARQLSFAIRVRGPSAMRSESDTTSRTSPF